MKNIISVLITMLLLASCRSIENSGFYEPITLDMKVPDGPESYQTGWHAGCRSAVANRDFANGAVYRESNGAPNLGNGVHQHDPLFQGGWSNGWFSCIIHTKQFMRMPAMRDGPLS